MNQNSWITLGIITSCKHKRNLYNELQKDKNATLASYYKEYSKILTMVIRTAKRMECDKLILNTHNKAKTTWDIINEESGRNKKRNEIQALLVEDKKITNQQTIAEIFNEYFISIADVNRQSINNPTKDNDGNTDT